MMKLIVKTTGANVERDVFLAYLPLAPKCEKCERGIVFTLLGDLEYCTCPTGNARNLAEMTRVATKHMDI